MNRFMQLIVISMLACYSAVAIAKSAKVTVDVSLFPIGSFDIESKEIEGKLIESNGKFQASLLKVPVISMKTGIALRDEHMQESLKVNEHPTIEVRDVSSDVDGKNAKAKITIAGVSQDINFTLKKLDKSFVEVQFSLNLPAYKIEDINYRGVGVEDDVQVTAIVPYETK